MEIKCARPGGPLSNHAEPCTVHAERGSQPSKHASLCGDRIQLPTTFPVLFSFCGNVNSLPKYFVLIPEKPPFSLGQQSSLMILKALCPFTAFIQTTSSQIRVEEFLAAHLRQIPPDHIHISPPLCLHGDKLDFASLGPALYNRRLGMK